MTFCEEAGLRSDLKNSVLCEHSGRKASARPPLRDEGHAVRAMKPGVWNKRLEHHEATSSMGKRDQAYGGGGFTV